MYDKDAADGLACSMAHLSDELRKLLGIQSYVPDCNDCETLFLPETAQMIASNISIYLCESNPFDEFTLYYEI